MTLEANGSYFGSKRLKIGTQTNLSFSQQRGHQGLLYSLCYFRLPSPLAHIDSPSLLPTQHQSTFQLSSFFMRQCLCSRCENDTGFVFLLYGNVVIILRPWYEGTG